jgi:3-dehydroquinate synthase
MAEAIKHGAIADAAYFELLRSLAPRVQARDRAALHQVVERSVAIKAHVVAEDEREHGRRAILNFGHTVAHALEAVTGYELLHGEAVAIGMLAEARLGQALGITDAAASRALEETVATYRLPTRGPATAPVDRLLDVMRHDKKSRRATVRFALLERIGTMHRQTDGEWTGEAPESAIRGVLAT